MVFPRPMSSPMRTERMGASFSTHSLWKGKSSKGPNTNSSSVVTQLPRLFKLDGVSDDVLEACASTVASCVVELVLLPVRADDCAFERRSVAASVTPVGSCATLHRTW